MRRFVLRLARTMGMPASELCDRMTMTELLDHWTDDQLEPWGPRRADWHAAQICTVVANQTPGRKTPVKMKDVLLQWDNQAQERKNIETCNAWVLAGVMKRIA
jgi:hypothetical protein